MNIHYSYSFTLLILIVFVPYNIIILSEYLCLLGKKVKWAYSPKQSFSYNQFKLSTGPSVYFFGKIFTFFQPYFFCFVLTKQCEYVSLIAHSHMTNIYKMD